ncbi:MAG: hypothetical protein ACI87E_001287 [Mariniblastus sp.]|jgi:hypothetical protein
MSELPSYRLIGNLFGSSQSWWYKAANMLRLDLAAANIPHKKMGNEIGQIDFHSFRGLMITNAAESDHPLHIAMELGRFSDQRLLRRYLKIRKGKVS